MNILNRGQLFYRAFLVRDPQTKRTAQEYLARQLAKYSDIPVYHHNHTWIADKGYRAVWSQYAEATREIRDRQFQLYQLAQMVRELPGDTAECGVFRGASSYLICAINRGKTDYHHHVFDSFEGLSEPEKSDRQYYYEPNMMVSSTKDIHQYNKGDLSAAFEVVQNNLSEFNFVIYHKGWIPERFNEVEDLRFSFVHIDVDLYQPTYDSISFFYDRVVPGGIIVCDDYGWINTPGAKKAIDEFLAQKPERVAHLTTAQGLIIKQ